MARPDAIVFEARKWIGTPYLHQASVLGAGTDCLGLLRGVWRALVGAEPVAVPPYTADWAEPSRQEALMEAANRWLVRKPLLEQQRGDVLLFRMRSSGIAKHLGIQSEAGERAACVHAYSGVGVVESPLSRPWQTRIMERYSFPEGAV